MAVVPKTWRGGTRKTRWRRHGVAREPCDVTVPESPLSSPAAPPHTHAFLSWCEDTALPWPFPALVPKAVAESRPGTTSLSSSPQRSLSEDQTHIPLGDIQEREEGHIEIRGQPEEESHILDLAVPLLNRYLERLLRAPRDNHKNVYSKIICNSKTPETQHIFTDRSDKSWHMHMIGYYKTVEMNSSYSHSHG